ncbi:catenin alpha-2 [Tachysurus ichikawai]
MGYEEGIFGYSAHTYSERGGVLKNNDTPEELEDDSDFEQEDYDTRSRTSVQTEDDQLIAGQSARIIHNCTVVFWNLKHFVHFHAVFWLVDIPRLCHSVQDQNSDDRRRDCVSVMKSCSCVKEQRDHR